MQKQKLISLHIACRCDTFFLKIKPFGFQTLRRRLGIIIPTTLFKNESFSNSITYVWSFLDNSREEKSLRIFSLNLSSFLPEGAFSHLEEDKSTSVYNHVGSPQLAIAIVQPGRLRQFFADSCWKKSYVEPGTSLIEEIRA